MTRPNDAPAVPSERPCKDCGVTKPVSEFYWIKHPSYRAGGHYSSYCKPCKKAREQTRSAKAKQKAKRETKRKAVQDIKSATACVDCNRYYPFWIMQFDHVRGEKRFELSKAGSRSLKTIHEEIAKCDIVCANCHQNRTYHEHCGLDSVVLHEGQSEPLRP